MDIGALLSWIILGGIAGWLSNKLFFNESYSLLNTIIIGMLGSIFGGFIAAFFNINGAVIGGFSFASIITATLGAVTLTFLVRLIFKK